jgi:hypothetical protein
MAFARAVRKAVPLMVELASVSGGGKTTTALLLAAGMIGPRGRVGVLDTEGGRGSLPADEPIIQKALPDGYEYDELFAPYTPERYVEKLIDAEKAGLNTLIIDSTSHEYEGPGGISEIAESDPKGWATAKFRHKRFLHRCLSSRLDLIFCFRALPKVKITGKGRDKTFTDLGVLAVQEKNWNFEMTLRWRLENETHFATLLKAPHALESKGMAGRMLSQQDGAALRAWKLSGETLDPMELVHKRARAAAELGKAEYIEYFDTLSKDERKSLAASPSHEANKSVADEVDRLAAENAPGSDTDPV